MRRLIFHASHNDGGAPSSQGGDSGREVPPGYGSGGRPEPAFGSEEPRPGDTGESTGPADEGDTHAGEKHLKDGAPSYTPQGRTDGA